MDRSGGSLIRSLRQRLGVTQEEFAHAVGVTVSTVNRWENALSESNNLAWKCVASEPFGPNRPLS